MSETMSNVIQIKRGKEKPPNNTLKSGELGLGIYSSDSLKFYQLYAGAPAALEGDVWEIGVGRLANDKGALSVGGTAKPVYFSNGIPIAFSDTIGSSKKPVYLNEGVITACSSTVGAAGTPVYFSSGTVTACSGTLSLNATSATKLLNSRTIQINLESTTAASFNGTANITPGVTGILSIENGGTGASSLAKAREALFFNPRLITIIPTQANDTTAKWGAIGPVSTVFCPNPNDSGWVDNHGVQAKSYDVIKNRPSDWGLLLNLTANETEVTQLWFTQYSGTIYRRSGNGNYWQGEAGSGFSDMWVPLLDKGNYTDYCLPKTGGTISGNLSVGGNLSMTAGYFSTTKYGASAPSGTAPAGSLYF